MADRRLGAILVEAGVLDESLLREALRQQRREKRALGRILVETHKLSENLLVQALSMQLNIPVVDLDHIESAPEAVAKLPLELARKHELVPFALQGKKLSVAMADPTDKKMIDQLQIQLAVGLVPHIAGPTAIDRAIDRLYD